MVKQTLIVPKGYVLIGTPHKDGSTSYTAVKRRVGKQR